MKSLLLASIAMSPGAAEGQAGVAAASLGYLLDRALAVKDAISSATGSLVENAQFGTRVLTAVSTLGASEVARFIRGTVEAYAEAHAQINQNEAETQTLIEKKADIDKQMDMSRQTIENLNAQIQQYSLLIANKQAELEASQAEEQRLNEQYKTRIRSMEETGNISYWAILFGANSFSDLLDKIDVIQEIAKADLTNPAGVFLGKTAEKDAAYLRHDGPEHVMAFAPTRSGKGVGLVVPTLLSWPGSAVVHDIKGENWNLTAGWRSRFSHCLLFNPTDARSAAYNPLLEVRRGAHEVRDVQNIADILVDPEGALERRNHWEKTSHALLVGAILHVLYAGEDKTLRGVANFLSDPACPFELTLHRMMTTRHLTGEQGGAPHPVVASAAREVLNKSENERSGVLSTAMSFLGLYRDPTVAEVTSRCDWRIADLISADHPVSLYLVVPPSDISRTKPLIRLILNQIGRRLTESLDGSDGIARRHQLLLMLDEFPALGRLDFFESALAFMAGYGLRAFLIAQSLNQIDKAYGANHSILDNCHVRIAFATNDERTAKRISEALGTATELRAQRNYAGHRLAPWLGHLMVSRQETARA